MPTSTKTKLKRKQTNRKLLWLVSIASAVLLIILVGAYMVFFSGLFNIKSFAVNSDDQNFTKEELVQISQLLEDKFKSKNIWLLNKTNVEDLIKDSFDDVKKVEISKSWKGILSLTVHNFVPAFVGCEKERQFLISCMYAEADGIFYQESAGEYKDTEAKGIYFFEVSRDALSFVDKDKDTLDERLNLDSLEGTRIYSAEEMKQVFAYLKYFERSGLHIKNVEIKGLKILEITTDKYLLSLSLQKGFDESVRDYEIFIANEETKKVLKNPLLEKLDLSFKDKVFYKLEVVATSSPATTTSTTSLIQSTSTTATTSTSTSSSAF